MNKYEEFSRKQQEEYNSFANDHIFYAFNEKQFAEGMKKFNLTPEDTDKIKHLGGGAYFLKADEAAVTDLFNRLDQEKEAEIKADPNGDGFIYDMFCYELENHEYGYTGEIQETLEALGYDLEDIRSNPALKNGLLKAMTDLTRVLENEE